MPLLAAMAPPFPHQDEQVSPHSTTPEFRRMVEVATLGDDEEGIAFAAEPGERAALAKRLGIEAVDALEGDALVRSLGGGAARARVTFHAAVVQSSVVSLEPVASRIDEAFEVDFLPRAQGDGADSSEDEAALDPDAPEPPGEVIDGWFDLGDMVAQYLSLAIDPYPRKPGEEFDDWQDAADAGGEAKEGPFAALKNWRSRA